MFAISGGPKEEFRRRGVLRQPNLECLSPTLADRERKLTGSETRQEAISGDEALFTETRRETRTSRLPFASPCTAIRSKTEDLARGASGYKDHGEPELTFQGGQLLGAQAQPQERHSILRFGRSALSGSHAAYSVTVDP